MSCASAEPPSECGGEQFQSSVSRLHASSSPPWTAVIFLAFKCAERGAGLSMARTLPQRGRKFVAVEADAMTTVFAAGGYRYIPAVFQYSGGVAAEPGFEIVRVRFHRPVPLARRLCRASSRRSARPGRPLTAFCACELRSPAPFTEDGFRAFNEIYAGTLRQWGVMQRRQPIRWRAAMCVRRSIRRPSPRFMPSASPCAGTRPMPTFVVAGSGEARRGQEAITAITRCGFGETSPDAIAEKARFVLGEMERRLVAARLRAGPTRPPRRSTRCTTCIRSWPTRSCAAAPRAPGLTWHYARPPVRDLEYEMDCRAIAEERVIS